MAFAGGWTSAFAALTVLSCCGLAGAFGEANGGGSGASEVTPAVRQAGASGPELAYDVASVRESKPDPRGYTSTFRDPPQLGRLDFENIRADNLVNVAYGVEFYQISGGPDWAHTKLFTIHARSEAADAVLARMSVKEASAAKHQMLQALLAERFKLQVHWTTKELPVYALEVGKGGVKFKAADLSKGPEVPERCGPEGCQFSIRNQPISMLAWMLAGQTGGEVVDKTGLSGKYDIDLRWKGMASAEANDDGAGPPAPPLPTALQEQLGLKLGGTRAPVRVLVIDHMEMPSEN